MGSLLSFLFVFKFPFKKFFFFFPQLSGTFPSYHKFLMVSKNGTETASNHFLSILCNRNKIQSGACCAKADYDSKCSLQIEQEPSED